MELEQEVHGAATRLASTPGVLLVKVETIHAASSPARTSTPAQVFATAHIPGRIRLPLSAVGARVSAFGAFEPSRPTDTPDTLLAELNRERKGLRLSSLPRDTDVTSLGFDDLGFLAYQIKLEIREESASRDEIPRLCGAA
jgi:hypothetical protein